MEVEVEILTEAEVESSIDLDGLQRLVSFVVEQQGARGRWTVAVVLTDDARLRALHHRFMGLDTVTDVMTFPLGHDGAHTHGGDVVVSVERAAAQAADFGLSVADEVRFLVVHGLLHLCRWNDHEAGERARMWDEQRRLLDDFDRRTAEASRETDGR